MIWVFAMGITSVIVSMRHFLLVRGHSRKKQAKYVALGICVPVVTGIVTYSVEFYTQKQIPDFTITTFVIAFALIGLRHLETPAVQLSPPWPRTHHFDNDRRPHHRQR